MDRQRHLHLLPDREGADDPDDGEWRRHLERCPTCRRGEEGLHWGRSLLRSLPELSPRAGFFEDLQLRIGRLERRRRLWRRSMRVGLRLVEVGAVLALGYLLFPLALARLDDSGRSAEDVRIEIAQAGSPLPSIHVVRPFSSLIAPEVGDLFAAAAAAPGDFGANATSPLSWPDSPPLTSQTRGWAAGWADRIRLGGGWPRSEAGAAIHGLRPAGAGMGALLVATPSWTFAAPPVSFHFVAARSSSAFSGTARSRAPFPPPRGLQAPFPPPRAE